MQIIRFEIGDTLTLKKKHPCGSDTFTVLRTGSDVKIVCGGCGRDMTFERIKLEKMIKKVTSNNQ
jgi:hypothetical protein